MIWMCPRIYLLLASTVFLLTSASGMMPGMGMPGGEPKAAAVVSDIKYIKCSTCEAMVKQATRKVKSMRSEVKAGQSLHESDIIEYLETMCDPYKPGGTWITHYDMVEDGDKLRLVDTKHPSKCNTECATIARSCSQISDNLDLSDLSEALFAGQSRSSLTQMACYEMSGVCTSKPPPVPKERIASPGPAHVPLSPDEVQHQELMQRMKAAGLGGQMYSRDDIMKQMQDLQEQANDGDIPTTTLTETSHKKDHIDTATFETTTKPYERVVEVVADTVAKAGEVVQDVVGQAKEVATAAVGKASSLLKDTLQSFRGKAVGEQEL